MRAPRGIPVLALVAASLYGATTDAREAVPPEAESHVFTPNMEPVGASPHAAGTAGRWNSDLAFWGNTAYQGNYDGFRIIDITHPERPVEILDYGECHGGQGDVVVWEEILVRTWDHPAVPQGDPPALPTCGGKEVPEGFDGLHVFDLGDPAQPKLLASVKIPGCESHTATAVPDLSENRLLVYSSFGHGCDGFRITAIPLDDPGNPVDLGIVDTGRQCHDVAVILGDAMLAACAGADGLTMMSIGGPRGGTLTAPVRLWTKSLAAEGVEGGHAVSFSWDGEIVLFGHEPGGGGEAECEETDEAFKKTLYLFSTEGGAEVGRWVLPRPQTAQENCTIHNFNVVPGGFRRVVVMGNYQAGISVVDFTDPAGAWEIAYADPAPIESGGDWSAYWYDGAIYESDMTRGLLIWRLDDPAVAGARRLGRSNPQTQEFTIPLVTPR